MKMIMYNGEITVQMSVSDFCEILEDLDMAEHQAPLEPASRELRATFSAALARAAGVDSL